MPEEIYGTYVVKVCKKIIFFNTPEERLPSGDPERMNKFRMISYYCGIFKVNFTSIGLLIEEKPKVEVSFLNFVSTSNVSIT